jgi:hypothetical protein
VTGVAAATIRPAARADLAALGRLGALLVREHFDFDPKRFIAATPQTERGYASFLGAQLEEPNVVILVAEQDREVIGYSYAGVEGNDYMSLRGPAGVLYDIVVDPAHLGRGVRSVAARRHALGARGPGRTPGGAVDGGEERARATPVRARRVPAYDGRDDARAEQREVVRVAARCASRTMWT